MKLHYRIIDNFEKEYTLFQLSLKYNIPEDELRDKLIEYYNEKDSMKRFKQIIYNIENDRAKKNIKDIIEKFENGIGTRKLAQIYNTTRYNIKIELEKHYQLLNLEKKYNSLIENNNKAKGNMKYVLNDEIREELEKLVPLTQISKKYKIPYTCLRRLVEKEKNKK